MATPVLAHPALVGPTDRAARARAILARAEERTGTAWAVPAAPSVVQPAVQPAVQPMPRESANWGLGADLHDGYTQVRSSPRPLGWQEEPTRLHHVTPPVRELPVRESQPSRVRSIHDEETDRTPRLDNSDLSYDPDEIV